jgi:hypothetical protein
MKLLNTLFFDASVFSSASASASVTGAGRRIGRARRMAAGTMPSMSSARVAEPITGSMRASSAASMPMWRARNSSAFSSSCKEGRAGIGMAVKAREEK